MSASSVAHYPPLEELLKQLLQGLDGLVQEELYVIKVKIILAKAAAEQTFF